jgi:hypothetical protein
MCKGGIYSGYHKTNREIYHAGASSGYTVKPLHPHYPIPVLFKVNKIGEFLAVERIYFFI